MGSPVKLLRYYEIGNFEIIVHAFLQFLFFLECNL